MENTNVSKIAARRYRLEVLEALYNEVCSKERDIRCEYEVVGKEETQAKDWRTGELLWEDEEHTIPQYRDKWGYVEKAELSDEDKMQLDVCRQIKVDLEKLM